MKDCMNTYSKYILLLDNKEWKNLSTYEKIAVNDLHSKLMHNLKQKLLKHSG